LLELDLLFLEQIEKVNCREILLKPTRSLNIVRGIENIKSGIFFEKSKLQTLRGKSWKLFKRRSRSRKNYSRTIVVECWNALPNGIPAVELIQDKAPSLNSFKARIDKHRRTKVEEVE